MTKQFDYESWWQDYDEINKFDPGTKLRKKLIAKEIASNKNLSILDLGCGSGELLEYLSYKFPKKELYGSDVSKKALEILRKKQITKNIFLFDLEKSSDIKGNYDIVICSEVIEHLQNWPKTIESIGKVTKKGGLAIITTQAGKRYPHHLAIGHLQHFDPQEINVELEKQGFRIKKSKRIGWPFMNLKNHLVTSFLKDNSYKSGKISTIQKLGLNIFYYLYQINLGNSGPQIIIVAKKK